MVAPVPPTFPHPHLGITLGCSLSAGLRNSARPLLTLAMAFSSCRHTRGPMPKLKHLQESWAMKSHSHAGARAWAGVFDGQRCHPGCLLAWGTPGEAKPVGLRDVMGEEHPWGWCR